MSSIAVVELRGVGQALKSEGMDYSAGIVLRAADRMERMEELIVETLQPKDGEE